MEEAEGLIIVPFWPTQPWYSAATLDNRYTEDPSKTANHTQHARERTRNTFTMKKMVLLACRFSRESLESQGISKKAGDVILQSLRQGTHKQYASYLKRWISFCSRQQIDCVSPTVPQALDFLVELYAGGIGYSGINTAKSALACIINLKMG